jgi:hypothetical protein
MRTLLAKLKVQRAVFGAESGGRHGNLAPYLIGLGRPFRIFDKISEQLAVQKPCAVSAWQWAVYEWHYF